MKKALVSILFVAVYALISARSLQVITNNATYSFFSEDMGNAIVDNGNTIEIRGCEFSVSEIALMQVVESDMADNQVSVAYDGDKAYVMVSGNIAQYVKVAREGAHVSITQSDAVSESTCGEITYSLAGASSNGSFSLYGSYKSSIDLCGVDLVNPNGAAIDIQNGKRIELSAKNSTENFLVDGAEGEQKAALYCKGHLEIKGKGALTVAGKKGHAISAKEYITVKNCALTIAEAAKDGINCSQYFLMESGEIAISNIGDDAIQVDYKDDVDRESEDTGSITIIGGKITATVTNAASKALKAEGLVAIDGGELALTVTGGGAWDDEKSKTKASSCINSDEDIKISGGVMTLVATGSGGKGISCDGTFTLTDGEINISTSGNVFAKVNNTIYDNYTGSTDNIASNRKSSAKGIKADTYLQIDGGTITVLTTGNNAEGIESKGELVINGGSVTVKAHDDGINSSSHMTINGGDICVIATNNDGLDSNGNLYVNGGTIRTFGASSPECGIDANEEGGYSVYFKGGSLLAVGGSNSTPSSSQSTQPYVTGNGSVAANNKVRLLNGEDVLVEFVVPANYNTSSANIGGSAAGPGGPGGGSGGGSMGGGSILITCEGLTNGASYTLEYGSSTSTVTAKCYGSSGGGFPRM